MTRIRDWPMPTIPQGDSPHVAWFLREVALAGASEEGMRLALILTDNAPCDGCNFVKRHCRCPERLS